MKREAARHLRSGCGEALVSRLAECAAALRARRSAGRSNKRRGRKVR